MTTLPRWNQTWNDLVGSRPPDALYEELIARYSEPHRAYHDLRHVGDCLDALDRTRDEAAQPLEIELALWAHDVIYDPRRGDNEERSAIWIRDAMTGAGARPEIIDRVEVLILATRHAAVPSPGDEALLVDIDLSILGASPERFDEYEGQIRQEYSWVPEPLFRHERVKILHSFLQRPRIYATRAFSSLEQEARTNLSRSIATLENQT